MTRPALPFALVSSLLALGACLQDFEQFRGEGTGGLGGGTTTTTTATTTTGMGGEGGQCDPALCPGNDTDCSTPACDTTGMCTVLNEPTTTACDDGAMGAKVCDGMGNCVECNGATDCTDPTKPLCDMNTCVAEHCQNGVPDPGQGETDVDCGGPDCADCMNGQGCMGADDCASGFCNGTVCAACTGDGNCDGATEWCDNGTCAVKKPNGQTCNGGNECTNGNCVDGVCCGTAGCPECQSCNIPGMEGTCNNDVVGTACNDNLFCTAMDACNGSGTCVGTGNPCPGPDGDNDCSESCDESNDNCNGNDPNGSACNDNLFCNGTDTCNSAGSCANHTGDPCPGPDGDGDCSETCDESNDNCNGNDASGSACNDNLFCNGTDTCNSSGSCANHSGDPCAANVGDNDNDCSESCSEANDNCTANDPMGSACNDGLFCTNTDACNNAGACVGAGNPCMGHNVGPSCDDSCSEPNDNCLANDATNTPCDEDMDGTMGMCNAGGNCNGD